MGEKVDAKKVEAAKRLERARARAFVTGSQLQQAAIRFALARSRLGATEGDATELYEAARAHTNAQHEVGRCLKAVRA